MKVAIVTPRYGPEIAGGAETAAREYATRLATRVDVASVEVLTTTALDAVSWQNHYPPGMVVEDGVSVHRFPVASGRAADFDDWGSQVLARADRVSLATAEEWIARQGPRSPELLDAIGSSDADVVAFHPYLYEPTVKGLPLVARRSVLHGAAHAEPPILLPVFDDLYRDAAALAFWSDAERDYVLARFRVAATRQMVLGIGIETGDGDPTSAREHLGIEGPILLCLGRVNPAKGTDLLAGLFAAYKERRPGPLRLVFAGPIDHAPPPHDDIDVVGRISDPVKWGALRAAGVVVSPSALESFGIVLLESWSVGTPVLVNERCAVTREHVCASRGGLEFGSYVAFEAALDRLLGDPTLQSALGESGRRYVAENYRWDDLLHRYVQLLEAVAAGTD